MIYMLSSPYKKGVQNMTMTKDEIRKNLISKRNSLSKKTVQKNSNLIIKNLIPYVREVKNIMIFMNMGNEIEITKLIELYPDKKYYIPKTFPKREMKINIYEKENLILHKFGYYESSSDIFHNEEILDLIIVPAIAFDYEKNRIGFGGGYYDTFLNKIISNNPSNEKNRNKPLFIGICYDFQLIENIPSEKHDIKMDIVITEKNVIY